MTQNIKFFENDGYSVEATEQDGCRVSLKITVKPNAAKKTHSKAIKVVNKQISIPGFRKGHAPNQTVVSRYSSHVEQEWKELLVNDAYQAAMDLTKIYPINRESISKPKIDKFTQDEGAVVSISYEHTPEVPVVDFSQLSIPKIEKEQVSEQRVSEILDEVIRAHADWEKVEGRAVQEGDFADVSIDSLDEDPPKSIVTDRRFEVVNNRLAPWLKKLLLGLEVGQNIEGVSEVDPLATDEVKSQFKPTHVRITLNSIHKIILPEMDEQLAQKVGAKSVEDLHERIRLNLDKEASEAQTNKKMEALEQALLENYHFDLPATVVESERKQRIADRLQALTEQSVPEDEILQLQRKIEAEVNLEIDAAMRLYYLNKQIAKQASLSLTNQELNDEIVRYLTQNPSLYQNKDESATKDLVSRMAAALMQKKAKLYALSQVEGSK